MVYRCEQLYCSMSVAFSLMCTSDPRTVHGQHPHPVLVEGDVHVGEQVLLNLEERLDGVALHGFHTHRHGRGEGGGRGEFGWPRSGETLLSLPLRGGSTRVQNASLCALAKIKALTKKRGGAARAGTACVFAGVLWAFWPRDWA